MIHYASNKISKTLLGYYDEAIDFCIITPITGIYTSLINSLKIIANYETGFYKNCIAETKFGKCAIIETPQGIQSQDAMHIFKNAKYIFLGFAGGINADFKVGEIIEANSAFDEFGNSYQLNPFLGFKTAAVGYSPALLGEIANQFQKRAEEFGCKIVDMETTYCAKVASKFGNRFSAFYVITDTKEMPFYLSLIHI